MLYPNFWSITRLFECSVHPVNSILLNYPLLRATFNVPWVQCSSYRVPEAHSGYLQATSSKLVKLTPASYYSTGKVGYTGRRPIEAIIAVVCLLSAPQVQLFASAGG